MSDFLTPFLMQSAVQAITPILLASLAGVLCGRVGVFNVALEGQMLVGAFAGMDVIRHGYAHAIASGYRFYSFGDACLLTRAGV